MSPIPQVTTNPAVMSVQILGLEITRDQPYYLDPDMADAMAEKLKIAAARVRANRPERRRNHP
jgi:hypothetical protein